jgi:hypothetical protein
MRAKHLIVGSVLLAAFAVGPVQASCAAPYLTIPGEPQGLRVGEIFTVRSVGGWGDFGCDDTGGGSMFGCTDEDLDEATGEPDRDIEIRLVGPLTLGQERRYGRSRHQPESASHVVLDIVDANEDGDFEVELEVPDIEPGRYAIDTPLGYDDLFFIDIRTAETSREQRGTPRLSLGEMERAAAADGRIDRREATHLAIGARPDLRVKDVEVSRGRYRGDPIWNLTIFGKLGCQYSWTIDARTGLPIGDTAGGGCS